MIAENAKIMLLDQKRKENDMATCKECLHFNVCESFCGGIPRIMKNGNHADRDCGHYKPTADVVPKSEVERLEKEIKALFAFKDYFSDLYGHGLEVANWHENGASEPFDNFYDSAEEEYERSLIC